MKNFIVSELCAKLQLMQTSNGIDYFNLTQDMVQWEAFVNMVMGLWNPYKVEYL
jgi:hypothetical protein